MDKPHHRHIRQASTTNNNNLLSTTARRGLSYGRHYKSLDLGNDLPPNEPKWSGDGRTLTIDQTQVHLFLKTSSNSNTSVSSVGPSSRPESGDSSRARLTSSSTRSPSPEVRGRPSHSAGAAGHSQGLSKIIVTPQANPRGGRPVPPPLADLAGIGRSTSESNLRRPRTQYIGKLVFQIDDIVYLGGIEPAYNPNLLCRLNIEYLVDISNVLASELPKSKRSNCPCLCAKETPHSRAYLTLNIDESTTKSLIDDFLATNSFVERAATNGKSVLIHSYNGTNRAVVFAIQYLMAQYRIGLVNAEQRVRDAVGKAKVISISDNFYRELRSWEHELANARPWSNTSTGKLVQFETKKSANNEPGSSVGAIVHGTVRKMAITKSGKLTKTAWL